jgi:hypothetical protein
MMGIVKGDINISRRVWGEESSMSLFKHDIQFISEIPLSFPRRNDDGFYVYDFAALGEIKCGKFGAKGGDGVCYAS